MTQPDFINEAYKEADREADLSLMTDETLINNFIHELDIRGFNLHILKAIRTLLNKHEEKQKV